MPRGYLLDTNVLSETRRSRPDARVLAFLAGAPPGDLFVSVVTLGEFRKGVEMKRADDPETATALSNWADDIEIRFADRIIPIDVRIAHRWGLLLATTRTPAVDALIAATALVVDLTVVTRNVEDFAASGASVLNPWTA